MKTYIIETHIGKDVKTIHLTADNMKVVEGVYMFYENQKLIACYPINSTLISNINY